MGHVRFVQNCKKEILKIVTIEWKRTKEVKRKPKQQQQQQQNI